MTAPDPRPAPSDADLIARWRGGDDAAATALVLRHGAAVARFLAAAGAGDDVEDLVQEAFFRAFRKVEQYRGDASFRAWVMTIGSNALKDLRRREGKRQILSLEERDVPDADADPHGIAVTRDLEQRLLDAIARLPALQRNVFLLRAQQGMAYDDLAAALDTTPGAARVHYHHAVKRLKAALE